MNPDRGTQYLTALAAPEELADWRLALCFEAAQDTGILDQLPATASQIAATQSLDETSVRAVLSVLAAWGHLNTDDAGVFSEGPGWLASHQRAALVSPAMSMGPG